MSKILDMAVAIDDEFDKLRYEIETIHCHANQLEEQLACQKMKNCSMASMLRELADRMEREEI